MILGDFNTELPSERLMSDLTCFDTRSKLLLEVTRKYNLKSVNTLSFCQGSVFTNVPYNTCRQTIIDHIFLPENIIQNVRKCSILDDNALNVSSHRPITCTLTFPLCVGEKHSPDQNMINWQNVKSENLIPRRQ